jgi:hypothetical protein
MRSAGRSFFRIATVALAASLAAGCNSGTQQSEETPAQPETAAAEETPLGTRIDVSKLGPQVGEQVPDFNLQDHAGKTWTRDSIMGPKGAMLVFFRSADW